MAEFARKLGLNADQVRQWRHQHEDRRPSHTNCALIERITEGAVTCEDLRPDVPWKRIKDASWPWHPQGRPMVDVTRTETAKAA